jgi:hypothetical protein
VQHEMNRRQIVVTIAGVVTVLTLPSKWTKPILDAVVVPAHAQASPPATTGTTTSTTTSTTLPPLSTEPGGTSGP